MVRRLLELTCLFLAFASVANAQASNGTGMCLTGLTPWVSSRAAGMKGDGYTTNSAYATTSPNAVQLSGSPTPNFSNASVGQLIWIYGGALAAPSVATPSFSGTGSLGTSQICAQVSYITVGTANSNLMTSESAPSTESCATPSTSGLAVNITRPSASSSNGVAAAGYGVYIGPTGQETLQNPNVSLKVTGASGTGSVQTYLLSSLVSGYNVPLYVGQMVTVNGFVDSGPNACHNYNFSAAKAIATFSSTQFTVSGGINTANCTSGQSATVSGSLCTSGTTMQVYYCALSGTNNFEAGNYNIAGQIPQSGSAAGYFLSTIASFVGTTQANLADTIPNSSGTSGSPVRAVWGSDNKPAELNLVPICQAMANSNNSASGCDIFIDPPGSPGSPTGLYLSSATWAIPTGPNNGSQGNILIRGPGSQKIQNAGTYANGLTVTNDAPAVSLAMLGRDYVITVGTPNTLSQGFSAINVGLADPTASSANQGTSAGGFHLQAVAGVHIMNSAGYEFSGGAGIHTDGIATSTQSVEIDSWDCLACFYSEALLPGSVDIKIEGGESSGLGSATTSLIPTTTTAPQGSIVILEEYANTVRVHLTDLQNFSTAGIYCYNSKNCVSDSTRHEQVGQSGITGSSAIIVDGTSSTNCIGFVVDKPQIASGFQYAVTVNSSCGNGVVSGSFNAAPLNILNNSQGTLKTVVEGWDPLNSPSPQVTSVQVGGGGDLGGTATVPTVTNVSHAGTIGVGNGGLGIANPTQYAVLVGGGTSPVATIGPDSTSNQPLLSAGSSANPSFGSLPLGTAGAVSGVLPALNGGALPVCDYYTTTDQITTATSFATTCSLTTAMLSTGYTIEFWVDGVYSTPSTQAAANLKIQLGSSIVLPVAGHTFSVPASTTNGLWAMHGECNVASNNGTSGTMWCSAIGDFVDGTNGSVAFKQWGPAGTGSAGTVPSAVSITTGSAQSFTIYETVTPASGQSYNLVHLLVKVLPG